MTHDTRFEAAALSKAAHFKGDSVPVVVRFSDGTGIPEISDSDPRSNPKTNAGSNTDAGSRAPELQPRVRHRHGKRGVEQPDWE